MDQRVIDLWDRLMAYGESGTAPLAAIRGEVLELHEAITDEESRLGLMRIFNLVCDLVAVHLEDIGGDLEAFAQHRQGQIWMFLRAECLVDGVLDRSRLRHVTGREVQAGRMTADDPLRRYALGDDAAFDEFLEPRRRH